MTTHTPGPWCVKTHPESTRLDAVYGYGGNRKIAYCQAMFGRPHVGVEEWEANARLIAAAPDLLAACEALLASHRPGVGQCCAASDMGIAAIARAKGE